MPATTAERLLQIMRERNLRQIDIINMAEPFCEQFGLKLTKSDMSQFVSGKVVPGQWKLSLLGRALNVSEAWLMGYDVPMERKHSGESTGATWTDRFYDVVEERFIDSTYADLEAAGISPGDKEKLTDRNRYLSFDRACQIADMLGISLDVEVMEREKPIHEDGRTAEAIELFSRLDPERQATMLQVLRGLLADQKTNPGSRG